MKADMRPRNPAPMMQRALCRASTAANDGGQPTQVAAMLFAVLGAQTIRRELGFDSWNGKLLSLVSRLERLRGGVRVSQFGWDTVCVVFNSITADEFAKHFQALDKSAKHVAAHETRPTGLEFIIGAASGSDEVDALERAEQALADAKFRGQSTLATDDAMSRGRGSIDLASELALAISRDELFLVYQPKVHVRQRVISSAEVLIRWQHPVLGLIMPDSFIGLADQTGEMRSITLWMLRRVIADQERLAGTGHPLRIFVNISGVLLTDRVFIDAACAIVQETGAEIGFEITETSVIRDPDLAIANLQRCAAIGITIAIDDYGSGLSSLSYLKRLPASELKIDKMFITQLTNSHRDPLIVRSTIDLAHALDMEVTAEGVETPAALALLSVMGCEMVQGFLISPPLELAAFETYLNEYQFEALQTNVEPTIYRPASFWKRA